MPFQIRLKAVRLVAGVALKQLLRGVHAYDVAFEGAGLPEPFGAYVTDAWSDVGVDLLVVVEVADLPEDLVAVSAHIGLLLGVDQDVSSQMSFLEEALTAEWTPERSINLMNLEVKLQVTFALVGFITDVALEWSCWVVWLRQRGQKAVHKSEIPLLFDSSRYCGVIGIYVIHNRRVIYVRF